MYARQSKARKDKSSTSTVTQLEAGRSQAASLGAESIREYEDVGRSGYDPDEVREQFDRMLSDARSGKIDAIVVYDVSRFSRRELKDAVPLVFELHALGVTLVSVTEGVFPPNDTMSLVMLIIRLDQAHKDSEIKSQKIRDTKAKLREAGSYVGGFPPYGYAIQKTVITIDGKSFTLRQLVVNGDEAAVLGRIVRTILDNADKEPEKQGERFAGSLSSIAETLNSRSVPTKRAEHYSDRTKWSVPVLKRVLRNPAIMGHAADPIYKESVTENGGIRKAVVGWRTRRDEEGRPILSHEGIISPEDWYAVQKWLDTRGPGVGLNSAEWTLSGIDLLFCECTYRMASGGHNASGGNYKCQKPRGTELPADSEGRDHDGGNTISKDHLEGFIARSALIRLAAADPENPEDSAWLSEVARRFTTSSVRPETAQKRTSLLNEKSDYEREQELMYDDLDAGIYNGNVGRSKFLEKKEKIDKALADIEVKLSALKSFDTLEIPTAVWLETDEPGGDPIGPGSWWSKADVGERRKMLRLLIDRVTVAKAAQRGGNNRGNYDASERVRIEWARAKVKKSAEVEW
ncbi:recombinase family protein [Streptomyces sp. NPDC054933]